MSEQEVRAANTEARRRWDLLGPWWGQAMGDGDRFHQTLIFPTLESMLPRETRHVLDLACGTGQTTRYLASRVARITALDYSSEMLSQGRQQSAHLPNISFEEADLLSRRTWVGLATLDAEVACLSMALHDIVDIEPIARGLSRMRALKWIMVVTPHPAFNHPGVIDFSEKHTAEMWHTIYGVKISNYLDPYSAAARVKEDQPHAQLVFHRPLNLLLKPFLEAGFAVDRLIEPFSPSQRLPGIPLVMGLRLVRVGP